MSIETESTRHGPCKAHQDASWLDSGLLAGTGRADSTALETKSSQAVANVCCSLATVSKRLAIHSVQTIIASDGFLAVSSRFPKSDSICRISRKRSIHERCMACIRSSNSALEYVVPAFCDISR